MTLSQNPPLQQLRPQDRILNELGKVFPTEFDLIAGALALGAENIKPWSQQECSLAAAAKHIVFSKSKLAMLREIILSGCDPLGDAFCTLRSPSVRRENGATYTPGPIIQAMVDWAQAHATPARIVDPGTGSARFLVNAGRSFPQARLVGVDIDPVCTIIARANLAVTGLAGRAQIILGDYRRFTEPTSDRTLYIGNPPYVRHHQITANWKDWLSKEANKIGITASKLAGLHVHFFLATARNAKPGDFGAFITAAEWLDVNYGALVRSLLLDGLGGQSITVINPTAQPFPDAATTAAITTFEIASKPSSVYFRRINSLKDLEALKKGRKIHRDRLAVEARWSHLTHPVAKPPEGYVELGELCRVHRGQVTGANSVWIAGEHSRNLPASVLYRSVTRAREIFQADIILHDASNLRFVIDIPTDLDMLNAEERRAVQDFLAIAKRMGANGGYIATHRKAWWSVGLCEPAPIISTYMARRPPAFVLNKANARHINIAHGIYPREPMSDTARQTLVLYLRSNVSQRSGRTYAGGLTKFEPARWSGSLCPALRCLRRGSYSD